MMKVHRVLENFEYKGVAYGPGEWFPATPSDYPTHQEKLTLIRENKITYEGVKSTAILDSDSDRAEVRSGPDQETDDTQWDESGTID